MSTEEKPKVVPSTWTKNQKIGMAVGVGVVVAIIIGITVWQLWPTESNKKKGEACTESSECASTVCTGAKCVDPPAQGKTGEACSVSSECISTICTGSKCADPPPYTNTDKCVVLDISGVQTYKKLSSTIEGGRSTTIQQWADDNTGVKDLSRFKWPNDDKNSPFLWDGYTFPLDISSPGGRYGKLNFVACPINTTLIK